MITYTFNKDEVEYAKQLGNNQQVKAIAAQADFRHNSSVAYKLMPINSNVLHYLGKIAFYRLLGFPHTDVVWKPYNKRNEPIILKNKDWSINTSNNGSLIITEDQNKHRTNYYALMVDVGYNSASFGGWTTKDNLFNPRNLSPCRDREGLFYNLHHSELERELP